MRVALEGHAGWVTSAAFFPNNAETVATAGDSKDLSVRIWDTATGACLKVRRMCLRPLCPPPPLPSAPHRLAWPLARRRRRDQDDPWRRFWFTPLPGVGPPPDIGPPQSRGAGANEHKLRPSRAPS
eukprot:5308832-Pyramimonas_sp.AAC.1